MRRFVGAGTAAVALSALAGPMAEAALGDEPTLYFRSTDYSAMMCETPAAAFGANLISHGLTLYMDATVDARWLRQRTDSGECRQLTPDQRFAATDAKPFNSPYYGVSWIVGVLVPKELGAPPIGYIPVNYIQVVR